MKCMGDFGEGYDVEVGDDRFESEMGFKIKIKKPKFKISPPKISIPKPIQSIVKPAVSFTSSIVKPVSSITSSIVKNPVAAVTTAAGASLLPTAIISSQIPVLNKVTAPVTDTIKAAASPVTTAIAPVALAPVAMLSPGAAQAVMTAAMPSMPKVSAQQEQIIEELDSALDTTPAAILTNPTAPSAVVSNTAPVAAIVSNTAPAVTLNSNAQPVLDTTPATIVTSSSSAPAEEKKKGGAGAVIGGLAVAGIAAYLFMKE